MFLLQDSLTQSALLQLCALRQNTYKPRNKAELTHPPAKRTAIMLCNLGRLEALPAGPEEVRWDDSRPANQGPADSSEDGL